MDQLRYLTQAGVDELRASIVDRLDWYYCDNEDELAFHESDIREMNVRYRSIGELDSGTGRLYLNDGANAIRVFHGLRELSASQASEERLWCYLCHFHHRSYVRNRWLAQRPESIARAIGKVENHFFGKTARTVFRDNGISRLWWLGYIANSVQPASPEDFLRVVLHKQDIRKNLLERPFVSSNRYILTAIYKVMDEHSRGPDGFGALMQREVFRTWMRGINRLGGVYLLDSLSEGNLNNAVRREARLALRSDKK